MTEIDRKFLEDLVARVNASVLDPLQLADDRLRFRKIAREAKVEGVQNLPDLFQDQHRRERLRYGAWFRELENTKRLPQHTVDDLLRQVRRGVTYELHADRRDGRPDGLPFVEARPQFMHYGAQAAYTFLNLASGLDVGCRVVGCKLNQCGRLMVIDVGHKGKPRQFCSKRCQDRYGKAQQRERERSKSHAPKKLKHK